MWGIVCPYVCMHVCVHVCSWCLRVCFSWPQLVSSSGKSGQEPWVCQLCWARESPSPHLLFPTTHSTCSLDPSNSLICVCPRIEATLRATVAARARGEALLPLLQGLSPHCSTVPPQTPHNHDPIPGCNLMRASFSAPRILMASILSPATPPST